MRLLTRSLWAIVFVVIVLHVMVHASRAQCSGGSCARPGAYYVVPAVTVAPVPPSPAVSFVVMRPVVVGTATVAYSSAVVAHRHKSRFRLFGGCR